MKKNLKVWSLNKHFLKVLIVVAITGMILMAFVMPADTFYKSKPFRNNSKSSLSDEEIIAKERSEIANYSGLKGGKTEEKGSNASNILHRSDASVPFTEYSADLTEGSIGVGYVTTFDNGNDNVFKLIIPNSINPDDKVILSYDLFGVQDQNSVARSINDRFSVGGYIVKKSKTWSTQNEILNPNWLKNGINTITFSTTDNKNSYKIKNLKIQVYKQKHNSVRSEIIVQTTQKYLSKNGKIYIKGFIQKGSENPVVEVNGVRADVTNGEFEVFVPTTSVSSTKSIVIRAFDEIGLLGQEVIPVHAIEEADYASPLENFPTCIRKEYSDLSKSYYLENNSASIKITDSALSHPIQISISKLRKMDIPPLDPGMINVTRGAKAYRFTPDGTIFNKNVAISIGYDTTLIPVGYSADDIKTYFYNIRSKRWEQAVFDTIDKKNKIVFASTNHFTDYINGIIQVPESPQTNAFAPTTMNGIKATDPSSNITLISPPEASQTGEADESYPIKIPAGRKGMQPSIKLQYNSNGTNGWAGTGWDLSVPAISIDTRWGVPTFGDLNGDGDNQDDGENIETEIYTLGGEQLMYPQKEVEGTMVDWMPNRHYVSSSGVYSTVSRPRLSSSEAKFTFRKQGSFAKIERLGDSPATYYWKVTGTDGTISWYGGKTPTDIQNSLAVIKSPSGNIVYWALFMTEDVYGNNVKYSYTRIQFSTITGDYANLSEGKMFCLSQIIYTGFNGADGNYKVEFINDTAIRHDVTINGRNGFKQIDPYVLGRIDVSYKNQLIRNYKLYYHTGRFSKTLLDSISENDKNDSTFYTHKFDYYDDVAEGGYFTTSVTERFCPGKCYTTTFPIPDNTLTVYGYRDANGFAIAWDTIPCQIPEGQGKLLSYEITDGNGTNVFSTDNLYLTHFKNHVVTNLCPDYPITKTTWPPDPVTQNTDFENDYKSWVYSGLSMYTPFNVSVTNESGLLFDTREGRTWNYNYYEAGFYSLNSFSGTSTVVDLRTPPFYWTLSLYKWSEYIPVSIPVTILVDAESGSHSFGSYVLSDQYYVSLFQQQFAQQYPGTPPPTIQSSGGNITIQVPNSSIQFNSITVTGGGVSNTYSFNPCEQSKSFADKKDWKNLKIGKEEVEKAITKSIAGGSELNMPIPDAPLNIVFNYIKDQPGTYMLHIAKDASTWMDNTGKIITDQKVINVLEASLKCDKRKMFADFQKQYRVHVQKNRELNMNKAKTEIEEANKALTVTLNASEIGESVFPKIFQTNSTTLPVNQITKPILERKPITNSFFDNLQNNYKIKIKQLSPTSDTGCDPLLNTTFHYPNVSHTFSSAGSILGSTKARSANLSGYIGLGIGCNPTTKITTFGYQYSHGWNWSESFISLVDIDGDGLDDVVVKENDVLYYKKHVITRTYDEHNSPIVSHSFLPNKELVGLSNFYCQKGQSSTNNFQITFGTTGICGFAGIDWTKSKSETNIYFTDANNDGLIDVVKNGTVFFNHLVNGTPTFEADSKNTENMVITASPKNIGTPPEYNNDTIPYPDNDVVKMWEAPADGTIKIENNIELTDIQKETEVTIEMQANNVPDTNCFEVGFQAPTIIDSVYFHAINTPCAIASVNYVDTMLWKPFSGRVNSINNVRPTNGNIWFTHYTTNGCQLIIPENGYIHDCQLWIHPWEMRGDACIQNANFISDFESLFHSALYQYNPFQITTQNWSQVASCDSLFQYETNGAYDILIFQNTFYTTMQLTNIPYTFQFTSCPSPNYHPWVNWGPDTLHYISNQLIQTTVGITTDITINTSAGSQNYGSYNLYNPVYAAQFQTALQSQYPGATVTSINGAVSITIPNTTSDVISITLTGGGTSNTYNFSPCGDSFISGKISDWAKAKPDQNDIEYAVKNAIAHGSEINLPVPDPELIYTVQDPESKEFYTASIAKNKILWKNRTGENIIDDNKINVLNSKVPFSKKSFQDEMQASYRQFIIRNRIKNREKVKSELESLYKTSFVKIEKTEPRPLINSTNCSYQPGTLCLLYGTILNHNQSTVTNVITNASTSCNPSQDSLAVKKGDRIYFRVHNVVNGNPPVNWNPRVEYTNSNMAAMFDQNGLTPFRSNYSDGFILSSPLGVIFPGNGTATISWDSIQVINPSDSVTYEIKKQIFQGINETPNSENIIYTKTCLPGQTLSVTSSGLNPIQVSDYNGNSSTSLHTVFNFNVKATSNLDWKTIEWKPKMICTSSSVIIGEDSIHEDTITTEETKYPIADYSIYKSYRCSALYNLYNLSANSGTDFTIMPQVNNLFDQDDNGVIYFVVKGNHTLIGTRTITITNGAVTYFPDTTIQIPGDIDTLEIGYYIDDSKLSERKVSLLNRIALSTNPVALVRNSAMTNFPVNKEQVNLFQKPNYRYGPMYRQWGQFMYNPVAVTGAIPIGSLPGNLIKEEALFNTSAQDSAIIIAAQSIGTGDYDFSHVNLEDSTSLASFETHFNQFKNNNEALSKIALISALPNRNYANSVYIDKWIGLHDQCYAKDLSSCASRFTESFSGFTNPEDETVQDVINTGAYSISKYSKGNGDNFSVGLSAGMGGVSYTKSFDDRNKSLSDYIDLNGDGYPDIVTTDEMQVTNRTGGLYSTVTKHDNFSGEIVYTKSDSWGLGANGSFSAGGKTNAGTNSSGKSSTKNPMHAKVSVELPNGNNSAGISGNYTHSKDESTRLWADINGDGLNDLLLKSGDDVNVNLNYGNNTSITGQQTDWGSFKLLNSTSDNWGGGIGFNFAAASIEAGLAYCKNLNHQEYTLLDINGDGLMDIVHSYPDHLNVRINYGTHFSNWEERYSDYSLKKSISSVTESANAGVTFGITIDLLFICLKIPISVNGQLAATTNSTQKTMIDYDGDGFPDLMEMINPTTYSVRYSNIRRTNKLKSVINPLGGKFTIDYRVITKDYNNPNAKWVMSEVISDDGYNLANDGSDLYRKDFEYINGKYDRREREFYGFEKVKTIDYLINPDSTIGDAYRTSITTYYNNNYYLRGEVKEALVCKGNDTTNLFSKQENVYELKSLTNNNSEIDLNSNLPLTFDVGGTEGRRTAIPLLKESTNKLYELGSSPMVSKTSFEYDYKGRVITFTNYGDIGITDDDYITNITYYSNSSLTAKNIINIPETIVVKDINNVILRSRSTDNINNSTGAIGKIIASIDNNNSAETVLGYDSFGNLNSIILPENDNGENMSYNYTHDADDAKYITEIRDAKSYRTTATYDPKFDVITTSHDITNNEIQYQYDDFGRLVKVIGPNEFGGTNPYTIKFEYFPTFSAVSNSTYNGCVSQANFVPVAITKHFDPQHQNNDIETYTFIDGLARSVQIKKDIEINTNSDPQSPPTYIEAMSVSGKMKYDDYGRVVEQFHPTWENKSCNTNMIINNTQVQYSSRTEYDELDRPVRTIDPDGNIATMEYSVASNLAKTRTVTDQNGIQSVIAESYKDVAGNVVRTINVGPNGDVRTSFIFDPIGELLSYTDDEGLTSTYTYDRLGHKLTFTHHDNGLTSYTYDKSGNISTLQTANLAVDGTFINYGYDYTQLISVTYPPTNGNPNLSNTTFTYGQTGSGNSTGRLITQTDATGSQEYEYDKMGNVVHNTRVVVAPSTSLPDRTFETYYTYDSWNRLLSLTYPDNEIVTYSYNLGGNVNQITGDLQGTPYNYLQRADYDHYEQQTYVKYGNNTENFYTYSPSLRRLNNLTVKSSGNEILGNDDYSYDKVGNITSLINSASPSLINGMGGASEHDFTYDVLNRLLTSHGSFTGDRHSQEPLGNDFSSNDTLNMIYTNTGRITTKTQLHNKNGVTNAINTYAHNYSYATNNHMVNRIVNTQNLLEPTEYFTYDRNGNLINRVKGNNRVNLYWDEANRLRVVSAENIMHHYLYDASGERIMKARSLSTQIYINGTLVNNSISMDNYTTYPSGFIVVDPNGIYSKHYYMGMRRIASRIGDGTAAIFEGKSKAMPELKRLQQNDMMYYFGKEGVKAIEFPKYKTPDLKEISSDGAGGIDPPKIAIYYYHPDHLGTNTIITNMTGITYQYFLNLPFGETMAEQMGNGYFQSPYKFNGKELDVETGLYYYGARYYDPRTSGWLSVDLLAGNHYSHTPYHYCFNNPIKLIDPFGNDTSFADNHARNEFKSTYNNVSNKILDLNTKINSMSNTLQNETNDVNKEILSNKIGVLNNERAKLDEMKSNFDEIIKSKEMFYYTANPNPSGRFSAGGRTEYNSSKDRYEVYFYSGNDQTIVHENTHGNQMLDGRISWGRNTAFSNYDYQDEFEAYRNGDNYLEIIKGRTGRTDIQIQNAIIQGYGNKNFIIKAFIQNCK
jgi:RHS repeat-associated protein